ncbi:unnamed protein product, partial [Didymodactylos carnosus]
MKLHTSESLLSSVLSQLILYVSPECRLFNVYGPAECTEASTYYLMDRNINVNLLTTIPIGRPLPNYTCYIMDDYLQPVHLYTVGELFIGGVGVFAGYYGRQDLTEQVLVDLPSVINEKCYRSGDLVKLDEEGFIHIIGRKDFQIKLRGQRIETSEIEETVLKLTSHITNCIVIKHEDYLIAYIEISPANRPSLETEVREYCRLHLPQYMIPSVFIIMEQFPLNSNGKVDRKRLTLPDLTQIKINEEYIKPQSNLEIEIHQLWCEVLQLEKISMNKNFFSLGGNSLLLIKLYVLYQSKYSLDVNIGQLFKQTTIQEHVQLLLCFLSTIVPKQEKQQQWTTMNITEGQILVKHLRQSLNRLSQKHSILRTSLIYDHDKQHLKQMINSQLNYQFRITTIQRNQTKKLKQIISNEELFHSEQGQVFRCHLMQYCNRDSNNNKKRLKKNDLIIFSFHHSAFDGGSMDIFISDFKLSYMNQLKINENDLKYIDYAQYERQLDMTKAKQYWKQLLEGYDMERQLPLPFDQHIHTHQRTGHGTSVKIYLNQQLVEQTIQYIEQINVSMFQLYLTCYYIYLYKIIQEKDLCVGSLNANRYRSELQSMIGVFVNLLPYRYQLNPSETFSNILGQVKQRCLDILQYSYLPYQKIIELSRDVNQSSSILPFIQTIFRFHEIHSTSINSQLSLHDKTVLHQLNSNDINYTVKTTKFDLTLSINYDPYDKRIQCSFEYSQDVFKHSTIETMSQRFHSILKQLFSSSSSFEKMKR